MHRRIAGLVQAVLKRGRFINTWAGIDTSLHNLNIVMATLRHLDRNPVAQSEMARVKALDSGDHGCKAWKKR